LYEYNFESNTSNKTALQQSSCFFIIQYLFCNAWQSNK